jgi:3-hydroxyisobutyrate dehydrogenase-like beta-hydroxyacid dehydrogenase
MKRGAMMEHSLRRVVWLGEADADAEGLQDTLTRKLRDRDIRVDTSPDTAFDGNADAVLTARVDDDELRALLLGPHGLLNADRAGLLLVDISPISEPLSREIAAAARRANVTYLRAPLTLGPGQPDERMYTAMVSGPAEAHERAHALLDALAGKIIYLGEGEEARAMTRVLDVMTGVSMAMWAEALVFGEAVGLDWHEMLEVMQTSAIGSPVIQEQTPQVAQRDFRSTPSCKQMTERLGAALAHGKATGTVLTLTGQAHQMYLGALHHGLAQHGPTAIVPWLETAAGVRPDAAQTATH